MHPLDDRHLECLREALSLLESGLKRNALFAAFDSSQQPSVVGSGRFAESAPNLSPSKQAPVNKAKIEDAVVPALANATKPVEHSNKPLAPVVQEQPTSLESAELTDKPETLQTSLGYFQSVPWTTITKSISSEQIKPEESTPTPKSGRFFKAVSWDKPATGSAIALLSPSLESVVAKPQKTAAAEGIIQSTPLAKGPESETIHEKSAGVLLPVQQCGTFFKEIAWEKPPARTLQKADSANLVNLETEEAENQDLIISVLYFQGIPWHGSLSGHIIRQAQRTNVSSDDRRWMAGLATQNALLTAARGVEQKQSQQNCQAYFQRVFQPIKILPTTVVEISANNAQQIVVTTDDQAVLASPNRRYFQNLPWSQSQQ